MARDPKIGVHQSHCCKEHGCKYGDEDCPVVLDFCAQDYPCEFCTEETTLEEYIQALVDEGFIAENGQPIKCHRCGSKDFDEEHDVFEHVVHEIIVKCKQCGTDVGHWAHGTWQV